MDTEQTATEEQIPPFLAHDGETYPRPANARADHVPVWHRFIDVPAGDLAEHISHWIVDPGPVGYLNATDPLDNAGKYVGNEPARCFDCSTPVMLVNGTFYRVQGDVILIRCQDDPSWDVPNVYSEPATDGG